MNLYLGTSGWAYGSWRPGFYPAKLPARRFLEFYAKKFNSVEVNYTFRSPQKLTAELAARWMDAVPEGFRFSMKAPWQVTHSRERLTNSAALRDFVKRIRPFEEQGKLGCVLFQLPPTLKRDTKLLRRFLRSWKGRAPAAFEFRHASWFEEEVFDALREANVALCVAESDELTTPEIATAAHAYYRFRRERYSAAALVERGRRLAAQLAEGREAYGYVKHVDSPISTRRAKAILKAASGEAQKEIG